MYKFEKILHGDKAELLKQANIPAPNPKFTVTPKNNRLEAGSFSNPVANISFPSPLQGIAGGGTAFMETTPGNFVSGTATTNVRIPINPNNTQASRANATGNIGGTGTVNGNVQPAQNQPFNRAPGFWYGKGNEGQRGYQYTNGFDYTNVNWDKELEYTNWLEQEQLKKYPDQAEQIKKDFQRRRQSLNTLQAQAANQYFDNLYNSADEIGKRALLDPLNTGRNNEYNRYYRSWYSSWQDNNRGRWQPQAPISNEQVLANSNVPWIADKYRKQIGQQNWNANVDAMMAQDAQKREQYRQWQAQRDRQDATKAVERYGINDTVTPDQWMAMNPLQRGEHINAYNRQQYDNRINDISGQIAGAQPVTTNPDIPKYMATDDYNQYRNNMIRVHGKAWDNRGFDDAARDDYIRKSYENRLKGMGIDPETGARSTGVDPTATKQTAVASAPSSSNPPVQTPKKETQSTVSSSVNPLDASSVNFDENGTMIVTASVSNIIPLLFNEKSSSIAKRLLNGNDLTGR